MRAWLALALFVTACGSAAVSPSPQPQPVPAPAPAPVPAPVPAPAPPPVQRVTYTGRVVSTQSAAPIPGAAVALDTVAPVQADATGSFTVESANTPLHAVITAPGYLTRETRLSAGHPIVVDLIATAAPFSSIFYGQLVRNLLEASVPDIVRTLPTAPSFYLQTAGLSSSNVDHLVAAARDIVPAMTGGRFTIAAVETGAEARPERAGWIVVDAVNEGSNGQCGHALVGAASGHIWLNIGNPACALNGDAVPAIVMRHETSHALGFFHIDVPNSLMYFRTNRGPGLPTDGERYHAAIAYARQSGNRDPDNDAPTSTPLVARHPVIVD